MVTSNDYKEIIEHCNSKTDPKGFLELYVWYLCQQLEQQNERIEWLKEQLTRA
jgi:bacterioferritin (cytochrome b1)